jgi:hypothetical protein
MPCMNAGVGKEMAADYDHRSCLPSGASRIWSMVYNRQQESNQGRTAGGGGGGLGLAFKGETTSCFMYQPWTYNMRIYMPMYVLCNMPCNM